jgi:hypothetical protein
VPAFDGKRPDRLTGVGLNMYDVMSRRRRRDELVDWSPERHRTIDGAEVVELLPALAGREPSAGYLFYDCQTDDVRLVLTVLGEAERFGTVIANRCEVDDYHLDVRIERAGAYLTHCWNKAKQTQPDLPALTPADFLYKAGEELVARALRAMPDVVLIVSAMYVHPDIFVLLKRAGIKV